MDRYAIALNKPIPPDRGIQTHLIVPAEKAVEPACHYECRDQGKRCSVESGMGWVCTRLAVHEGPHVACTMSVGRHELHIWYLPGEDVLAGEGPYR